MLSIHIFSLLFSLGTVMTADKDALAWMRGKQKVLSAKRVRIFHILTWGGLLALILSGVFLSLPTLSYLLTQPFFIMKLLFVAILVVNAFVIDRYSDIERFRVGNPFLS